MTTPDPELTRLGATIHALRQAHGIRPSDFAIRIGMSHAHLSNIEAGRKRPTPSTIHAIADALGVPVMALVPTTWPMGDNE